MATGMQWTRGRLRAAREVARDVRLLELEPEDGVRTYATGSHLDVEVRPGETPDVRSYSLVGDAPVDGAYRVAVKRVPDSRGGSRWHWGLQPGARIALSHPASHFELQLGRPAYVLLAGGIGITPIVGMAATLRRRGASFRLLYTARSRAHLAFADELVARLRLRDHGGREVVVPPNRTALEALQDAGVSMLSDCLRGECGLCVADVLGRDGEIDHRDVFLSEEQEEEGAAFCTCVSRVAGGTITIDTGFRPDPGRRRASAL
jgi:ferredoxin